VEHSGDTASGYHDKHAPVFQTLTPPELLGRVGTANPAERSSGASPLGAPAAVAPFLLGIPLLSIGAGLALVALRNPDLARPAPLTRTAPSQPHCSARTSRSSS
jgi:hypothetical protein